MGAEISTRRAVEKKMGAEISTRRAVEKKMEAEISRRRAVEKKMGAEISTRRAVEKKMEEKLEAEISTRRELEEKLEAEISTRRELEEKLEAEISTRRELELEAEISTRRELELEAEISTRRELEAEISTRRELEQMQAQILRRRKLETKMQAQYKMLERGFENCPKLMQSARTEALESLTNRHIGVISIRGVEDGIIGMGKLRTAKYIVKEVMDRHLFDIVIWISMQWGSDWSVRNIQMTITERLGLVLPPSYRRRVDYKWDDRVVASKIYDFLENKKFLLVLEDPPLGIEYLTVGVPQPGLTNARKMLIITASENVCKVMETKKAIWLSIHDDRDFLDLMKEECLNVADSLRFHDHQLSTQLEESIVDCFKCIVNFSTHGGSSTELIYCWLGERLLIGSGSGGNNNNQGDIITEWEMGQDLLTEFTRWGLTMSKEDGNICVPNENVIRLFIYCMLKGLIFGSHRTNFANVVLKLEGYFNSIFQDNHKWADEFSEFSNDIDQLDISRFSNASTLVIRCSEKVEHIPGDSFNQMEGLRVLQISGASSLSSLPARLPPNLIVLNLRNCCNLRHIPPSIQVVENLEILDLSATSLVFPSPDDLSFSLEGLRKLRLLNLSNNPCLSSLPSSFFSNMSDLEQLLLENCESLFHLPEDSFQSLVKLRVLNLSNAHSLLSLPSSLSHCINLKALVLRDCFKLEMVVSHLTQLQDLKSLDLSGCKALQDISSFGWFKLPNLRFLDISRTTTQLLQLSLRGYRSLETLELEGVTGVEVLDLSGTKIKRFPHEVCSSKEGTNSLKRLYLLGTNHLCEVDWEKIHHLPKELLIWDQCCNNDHHHHHDQQPLLDDKQLFPQAFISVSSSTKIFKSVQVSYSSFFSCLSRLHVTISPCCDSDSEQGVGVGVGRGGGGGNKEIVKKVASFEKKKFLYRDIYYKSVSSRSSTTTSLTPTLHFAHFTTTSEQGHFLEINSQNRFPKNLRGVLYHTQFLSLHNNRFVESLDEFGDACKSVKECWIESCHGLKHVFSYSKRRRYDDHMLMSLRNLWVSNLARLTNLIVAGATSNFSSLKQIRLEYCPMLKSVLSHFSVINNTNFPVLETLEIRFCGRLEIVFNTLDEVEVEDEDEDEVEDEVEDEDEDEDEVEEVEDEGEDLPSLFPGLKTLLEDEDEDHPSLFPGLKTLSLWELPALKTICSETTNLLHCRELKEIRVRGCPNLRKLPFRLTHLVKADKLINIKGEPMWWNNLEWEKDEVEGIKRHINFVACPPFTLPNKHHRT